MNRKELIKKLCKNKAVLNIGCTGHPTHQTHISYDMQLRRLSKSYVGTDIEPEAIEYYKLNGAEVMHDNILTLNKQFINKFDVVVLTEVLEHIEDISSCINNCKQYLNENGVLLMTLPNIFGINRVITQSILKIRSQHYQHVTAHCMETATHLFNRFNLNILEKGYINNKDKLLSLSNLNNRYKSNLYFILDNNFEDKLSENFDSENYCD